MTDPSNKKTPSPTEITAEHLQSLTLIWLHTIPRLSYRILEIVTLNTDPDQPLGQKCHELAGYYTNFEGGRQVPPLTDEDAPAQNDMPDYELLRDAYSADEEFSPDAIKGMDPNDIFTAYFQEAEMPEIRKENDDKIALFLDYLLENKEQINEAVSENEKIRIVEHYRVKTGLDTDNKPPQWS